MGNVGSPDGAVLYVILHFLLSRRGCATIVRTAPEIDCPFSPATENRAAFALRFLCVRALLIARLTFKCAHVAHRVAWFATLRFRIVGLAFKRPDVAQGAARLRTRLSALIRGQRCTFCIEALGFGNLVYSRATRQKRVRLVGPPLSASSPRFSSSRSHRPSRSRPGRSRRCLRGFRCCSRER